MIANPSDSIFKKFADFPHHILVLRLALHRLRCPSRVHQHIPCLTLGHHAPHFRIFPIRAAIIHSHPPVRIRLFANPKLFPRILVEHLCPGRAQLVVVIDYRLFA